jgi:allantoinase
MNSGEWTLRSRRVVTPSGTRAADVLIRKETIFDLLPYEDPEAEGLILDVGDLVVLPGLVALHREGLGTLDPRRFEAVTRDSGAGGVTTLVDLPPIHTDPLDASATFRRMAAAQGTVRVDCGLVVALGRGQVDRIESWIEAGFLGIEAILSAGTSDLASVSTEADLRAAMPILAELGRPLIVDCGRISRPSTPPDDSDRFGSSMPEGEFATIHLLIRLCRETRCPVHLVQTSATEALPILAHARSERLPITVETCPRHLVLTAGEVVAGAPTDQFDPARRPLGARDRLWDALETGLIDAIGPDLPWATPAASEVQPAHRETRSLPLPLPEVWAEARRRGFTLDHLARWLASRPARALGLANRKGSIARGLDADFVIFDPDAPPHADPEEDRSIAGRVEATILRGTMIYQGGRFFEHPKGSVVLRLEATQPIAGAEA